MIVFSFFILSCLNFDIKKVNKGLEEDQIFIDAFKDQDFEIIYKCLTENNLTYNSTNCQ